MRTIRKTPQNGTGAKRKDKSNQIKLEQREETVEQLVMEWPWGAGRLVLVEMGWGGECTKCRKLQGQSHGDWTQLDV